MRTPPRRPLLLVLCLLLLAHHAAADSHSAEAETVDAGGAPRVRVRLVADPATSGAADVRVGVLFEMAPGWHVYARDPGETGLPTELRWSAPEGAVAELPWPDATPFTDPELGLRSFGYTDRVLLPARATFAAGADRRLSVAADFLACADACVPGSFRLERDLAAEPLAADAVAAPLFAGLPAGAPAGGLLRALLLALVGGLLLNLMPCVLPVLAIKALALVEGASHRRDALAHGSAYLAGVLASMAALAAGVLVLRSGGRAVGWGFQFQEPAYLVVLAGIVVIFAANLLGAFEIRAGAGRLAALGAGAVGARRSFFDGLLTVALATPCSAPFLGTAAGFAMAAPALATVAVFLAIGLGLAAPLALVAVWPGARRWLPKPGPWMADLRAGLGFLLLATAVWLVWVLGRSAGNDAATGLLAALVVLGALCWGFGRLQARDRAPRARPALVAGIALLALGAGLLRVERAPALPAEPWEPGVVARHLSAGRPTFVYFTADWCITCKLNERVVLSDPRVAAALAQGDFAVVRGDWTRRDERLGAEIARLGRAGVPLYAIFRPGAPDEPRLLPELLSVTSLLDALADADDRPAVTDVTRTRVAATMQEGREDHARSLQ